MVERTTTTRVRSPSPVRTSARDVSWRDKLGAGEKPAARDTLDVEKPSKNISFFLLEFSHMDICLERKERRDPPKFSEQLVDITAYEGKCLFLPLPWGIQCCSVSNRCGSEITL